MNTATEDRVIDMLDLAPMSHNTPALQGSREVITEAPAKGSPLAGALAFLQAGGNPEQLREMMQLEREWKADLAKQAFTEAMAAFKIEAIVILKDKHVEYKTDKGVTAYDHATLGKVVQTVAPRLALHGLSSSWDPKREGDRVVVTCKLTHRLGHSESVTLEAPLDSSGGKNNIQAMGSSISYLERYTFLAITGLSSVDQDNDGRGGGGNDAVSEEAKRIEYWRAEVAKASTANALQEVRRKGTNDFQACKDRDGYAAFAAAVKARAAQLEAEHA